MANQEHNQHTTGSSLEIFLFTNGQQDTPPRKYNIRVDDRWDTTLSFLAGSQNGTNRTIELYSTEGKKIERGQELTNGAAYVAVEPPQPFLPAGYNDYLMKASRSREKRQEKLSLNEPSIKMEDENKDATNLKLNQVITIRSTIETAVEGQDDITNQVKSDIAKAVKPIKRMSIKQTQKRNSSLPPQSPMRKNSVTPPIKRGYNTLKIDTGKKKVEISSIQNTKNSIAATKTGTNITKTNEIKSKGDDTGVIAVVSRNLNPETVDIYSLEKNPNLPKIPGFKKTIQNSTTDSSIIERNILLPVSPEKEPFESTYIIPIKTPSITNLSTNGKGTLVVPSQDAKNEPDILNSSPAVEGRKGSQANNGGINNVPNESFQKKALLFGSQTNDNNFAIYVRQGNMVNLKLNIEVKNVSNTTFDAIHNQISSSSINTPMKKFDAGMVTNGAGGENYREVPTLTEPWLAKLPYEQLQQITNDLKIGACNCCPCSINPESLAPVFIDNNNYFILLPPEEVNEHLVSCTCNLDINEQSRSESPDNNVVKLSRIENNIVKLDESKTLPTHTCNMTENFEIRKNIAIHDPKSIEYPLLLKNTSITEREVTQCECWVRSTQYQMPACDCGQSLALQCSCDYDQAPRSDVVKQGESASNKSLMHKDAFTQTDWSAGSPPARRR